MTQQIEDAIHAILCAGLNLHEADIALDEARRKLWCAAMAGRPAAAASTPTIEAAATKIADLLGGLPLASVVEPIEGVRCRIWAESFGERAIAAFNLPESGTPLNG